MVAVRRLGALVAVLACALAAGVFVGGSAIAPGAVVAALLHPARSGDVSAIVWSLRVPRTACAAVVGAALGAAGFLLQGLLRNPLVDPFLTGVSAGAGAAIVVAVAAHLPLALMPGFGFVSGLATALLVAVLARSGRGLDGQRLILAGVAVSALLSAVLAVALQRLDPDGIASVLAYLAGSLAGRGWDDLAAVGPYALGGLALAFAAVPALNALRLGTGVARDLGVDVARAHWLILVAATLLTAAAVALGGIIGFVGLIVPHVARRLVGTDGRLALAASVLGGAAVVAVADALSRSIAPPAEIPLGALLAIVGVPAFLYLTTRSARRETSWRI